MKYRLLFLAGAAASTALAFSVMSPMLGSPAAAATAPPTPPPLPASTTAPAPVGTASPAPFALPTLTPVSSPHPGKTPEPPKGFRKGIEGVWEVQIQRGALTEYDHFQLVQDQNAVTGFYLNTDKKKSPLAGSLDGKTIRIVVTFGDGTSATFVAQLDGTTDMLGLMTTPKETTPFTAAYRPKESFFDNINPAPGGIGGGPTGGGGRPPR
ncbi:MAG: hypothetical protein M3R30_02015 [Candidatus Eremiobacteraeota bacterium]|nr:hypothetical protein [Candidatus Eremiobacteraeota bacterium]